MEREEEKEEVAEGEVEEDGVEEKEDVVKKVMEEEVKEEVEELEAEK